MECLFMRCRRWWVQSVLGAALVLTATMLPPQQTAAYTLITTENCQQITFAHPEVKVVVHLAEFQVEGPDDTQDMLDAISEVSAQMNAVGQTSIRINTIVRTFEPFVFGTWFGDTESTIHVGFAPDSDHPNEDAGGFTRHGPRTACQFNEAHILFLQNDNHVWTFVSLEDILGLHYYNAEERDSTRPDHVYFRPKYCHELLHAFGLAHSPDTYAMMNRGARPWANRPRALAIRPLPDDVRGLRYLYPALGSRNEVSVLTTWYDPAPNNEPDGVAIQYGLCAPSLGTDYSSDKFSRPSTTSPGMIIINPCGTGGPDSGSMELCFGDTLHTRFALANYSTHAVHVHAQLWFSRADQDDQWDESDVASPTWFHFDVDAGHSADRKQSWLVPRLAFDDHVQYHAIVRVVATSDADGDGLPDGDSVIADWIPLRKTVQGCDLRPDPGVH